MAVGVDLGAADLDVAGGESLGREAAQRDRLGVVPGLLGEGLARAQRPGGADGVALRLGARVVGDRAGIAELHVAHGRDLAGLDGDHDLARRLVARGRLVQLERERGREVAQRGEQLARIGLGRDHQARDLGGAEVVERLVALDLEVQREVLAHAVWAAHVDREGIAALAVLALPLAVRGRAGRAVAAGAHQRGGGRGRVARVLFRQQAAALQMQDAGKKQCRPTRRQNDTNHPEHGR